MSIVLARTAEESPRTLHDVDAVARTRRFRTTVCDVVQLVATIQVVRPWAVIVVGGQDAREVIVKIRCDTPCVFVIVFSQAAANDPVKRIDFTDCGARMVTDDLQALNTVLDRIHSTAQIPGNLKCQFCHMDGFTLEALIVHVPLYHVNESPLVAPCSVCGENGQYSMHLRTHIPGDSSVDGNVARYVNSVALVVVRRPNDGKYLLVQEYENQGYWIPGGRVEMNETIQEGAEREVLEEVGIHVKLTGILEVQYFPHRNHLRVCVVFLGEPVDLNERCKTVPDYESVGAVWATASEIVQLQHRLRGNEALRWSQHVEKGGYVADMSILPDARQRKGVRTGKHNKVNLPQQ